MNQTSRRLRFQQKSLKAIFLLASFLALAYPLVHIIFVFPAYQQLLVRYAEDDAGRVASHLAATYFSGHEELRRDSIPENFSLEISDILADFNLEKVKTFSPTGEIIFSTDPKEIGTINTRDYFQEVVRRGEVYTKLVSENTRSLEGVPVKADVVETYQPIMHGDRFAGAFEIYFDITERTDSLKRTALRFSALPFGLAVIFLLLVTGIVVGTSGEDSGKTTGLPGICRSPGSLLLFSSLVIFTAEVLVLILLSNLLPLDEPAAVVLNATLLVMAVAPGIYFFFLQPLFAHMAERQKAEQQFKELSITDELTGLLNRRGFFDLADKLLQSASRTNSAVTVLFADLNGLKCINDHLGHEKGDQAIKETGELLQRIFRESDIVARMGGDEFAVCTKTMDDPEAWEALARRVGEAIRNHQLQRKRASSYAWSLSWGTSTRRPGESISIEELLKRADAVMYAHKQQDKPLVREA